MIEADVVDCMVALAGQLFYSTQIPACLWFLARDKTGARHASPPTGAPRRNPVHRRAQNGPHGRSHPARTHRGGDQKNRRLLPCLARGGRKGEALPRPYADVGGFCKSATLEEVRRHGYMLTPGRYVGDEAQADDGEPFAEKMARLVEQLRAQQAERARGADPADPDAWRAPIASRSRRTRFSTPHKPDDFILAMVELPEDGKRRVRYLRQPFRREPDFGVTSVNYDFAKLLARAENPVDDSWRE